MFWRKPNIAELEASKDIYGLAKVLKKRNHDYRLKALDSLSNLGDLSKPVIPEILNFYEKSYLNHEKDKSIESIYHIDSKLDSVRVWLQKRPSFENIVGLLIRLYAYCLSSENVMPEVFTQA